MIATREQRKEVPQTFKALPPQFENHGPRSGHWLPTGYPSVCVCIYVYICIGVCRYICRYMSVLGKLMLKTHAPYPRCDMPQ